MVPPAGMCRKHLLGEHVECHMFASVLRRGWRIDGYIKNNCLEPSSLVSRHDALAAEMVRRGYDHASPLGPTPIDHLPQDQQKYRVDALASRKDLLKRCADCRERMRSVR